MSEDAARLLAELHAARSLLRAGARRADRASGEGRVTTSELWAYFVREPGAPVDLAVVRALRTDADAARRYRTLLAGQAMAHAPFAIAASDGSLAADAPASRRVGAFTLDLIPAQDDAPPLLVIRGEGARAPWAIEVGAGEEVVRLALPPMVEGAVVLALDPAVAEADRLGRLLRDPASAVFLL